MRFILPRFTHTLFLSPPHYLSTPPLFLFPSHSLTLPPPLHLLFSLTHSFSFPHFLFISPSLSFTLSFSVSLTHSFLVIKSKRGLDPKGWRGHRLVNNGGGRGTYWLSDWNLVRKRHLLCQFIISYQRHRHNDFSNCPDGWMSLCEIYIQFEVSMKKKAIERKCWIKIMDWWMASVDHIKEIEKSITGHNQCS